MTLESRVKKLVVRMIPFRDPNCLIKKLEDLRDQAKKEKEIWAHIRGWRFEAQQDYVYHLEAQHQS
jgi:hypothetical protein